MEDQPFSLVLVGLSRVTRGGDMHGCWILSPLWDLGLDLENSHPTQIVLTNDCTPLLTLCEVVSIVLSYVPTQVSVRGDPCGTCNRFSTSALVNWEGISPWTLTCTLGYFCMKIEGNYYQAFNEGLTSHL